MVNARLERKIRRRLDQLYDDIVSEGYDERDIEKLIDQIERDLIDELDLFEEED